MKQPPAVTEGSIFLMFLEANVNKFTELLVKNNSKEKVVKKSTVTAGGSNQKELP